jgi:hypothetical protein
MACSSLAGTFCHSLKEWMSVIVVIALPEKKTQVWRGFVVGVPPKA